MLDIEFYVRDVVFTSSGELIVVGVPNNGVALSLGDRFVTVYELGRDDVMSGTLNPARLNSRSIDLRVEKIDVIHEEVQQVSHGVTAGISLSGHGLEHVVTGRFLRAGQGQVLRSQVSEDGTTLRCFLSDGTEKWARTAPTAKEWLALFPRLAGDPELGKFRYAGNEWEGFIYALFTPLGAEGYNLKYDATTGELLEIHENRWG